MRPPRKLRKGTDASISRRGRGGRGGGGRGGAGGGGARLQFGTDLVLRTIADASERTFSDVAEFSLSHDGKQLVYAVSAHDTSKNGVFVVNLAGGEPTRAADRQGQVSQGHLG